MCFSFSSPGHWCMNINRSIQRYKHSYAIEATMTIRLWRLNAVGMEKRNKIWNFFTFLEFFTHYTFSCFRAVLPLFINLLAAKGRNTFSTSKEFSLTPLSGVLKRIFPFGFAFFSALCASSSPRPAFRMRVGEETFQLMTLVKVKQTIKSKVKKKSRRESPTGRDARINLRRKMGKWRRRCSWWSVSGIEIMMVDQSLRTLVWILRGIGFLEIGISLTLDSEEI